MSIFHQKPIQTILVTSLLPMGLLGCQHHLSPSAERVQPYSSTLTPSINASIDPASISHATDDGLIFLDPNYAQKVSQNMATHNHIFNTPPNIGHDAKADLLSTIHKQLDQGFVSVTQLHSNAKPFITEGSVDAGSQSLLMSVGKWLADMTDTTEQSEALSEYLPYRTFADYQAGGIDGIDSSSLYLNYKDEMQGITPTANYAMTWEQGLNEASIEEYEHVYDYIYDVDSCLVDFSYALDTLVEQNPKVSWQNDAVQSLKQNYDGCVDDVASQYDITTQPLRGYREIYYQDFKQCMTDFENRLIQVLGVNRTLHAFNFDDYDSVYLSYEACYDRIDNLFAIEPYGYLSAADNERTLTLKTKYIECADDLSTALTEFESANVTYATEPKRLVHRYDDYESCIRDADDASWAYETVDSNDINHDLDSVNALSDGENMERYTEHHVNHNPYDKLLKTTDYIELVDTVASLFKRTPEQVAVLNSYYNSLASIHSVQKFDPSEKRLSMVYNVEYVAPTIYSSIKLPVAFDFKNASMTVDPDAVMPIVALMSDAQFEATEALTQDLQASTVQFKLPQELTDELPAEVVFDALIEGLKSGLNDINPSYFSDMDISQDVYAKDIGAKRGIKLHLDSKQTGELLGHVIKVTGNRLNDYIQAHPDQFAAHSDVKKTIDKWQEINLKYQTHDVGSIVQLVEAIAPISLDRVNLYYLDSHGNLIAKREQLNLGGDLFGLSSTTLSDTQYGESAFVNHPLFATYEKTFGKNVPAPMDGNAWLELRREQQRRLDEAENAREGYEDISHIDRDNDGIQTDDSESHAIDEYGNDEFSAVGFGNDKAGKD